MNYYPVVLMIFAALLVMEFIMMGCAIRNFDQEVTYLQEELKKLSKASNDSQGSLEVEE